MSVIELEQAVTQLPQEELSGFTAWFEEFLADEWDRKIERDAASGKLDAVLAQVDAAIDAGRVTPL